MAPRRSGLYSLLNDRSSEDDMMSESDIHSGNTSDGPASPPPSRSHSRVASNSPNGLLTPTSMGSRLHVGPLQGPMRSDESTMAQGLSSLNKPVEDMFPVRIDTYTASKEAGDKRQKNADASARYRRRKADQAAEEKSKMAQLQEENRYLGGRVIELTRQREFYRSERQALRELLLTVPELKDAAKNRPPTPLPPFDEH
ncbi:hypothetical protein jhhlp_001372 [Lomentospora prolificans]|uniref:BZIP domain-containing protein n=1 Tax=Lomentospora prolificans TaxID=41688 RepID=A0A2N3NHY2_9PEZI|nr:hypothetical protein jhhlp_001372 [Lomentospora prolificans]